MITAWLEVTVLFAMGVWLFRKLRKGIREWLSRKT
jgi:ABC-type polysaccharide/polyol phosphate export permease